MRFRECMSKDEGVAGYVEAFWHVLSESQTAHMYQLLIIQCTRYFTQNLHNIYLYMVSLKLKYNYNQVCVS